MVFNDGNGAIDKTNLTLYGDNKHESEDLRGKMRERAPIEGMQEEGVHKWQQGHYTRPNSLFKGGIDQDFVSRVSMTK
jgi:hypothetical protein